MGKTADPKRLTHQAEILAPRAKFHTGKLEDPRLQIADCHELSVAQIIVECSALGFCEPSDTGGT